mmetsp:Transcript_233/g.764  ORF Transcript_233/g.764 Transcript_233/m.764 type:complete len:296 (-) Transcript_233:82-969(-)
MVVVSLEDGTNWPVPITPLPPEWVHEAERERALAAQSLTARPKLCTSDVLYKDPWLMAVNKPAGMYCDDVLEDETVQREAAATSTRLGCQGAVCIRAAHRLDRDTSGVMILSVSPSINASLTQLFSSGAVHKEYFCLGVGAQQAWTSTTVRTGHGRSRYGLWRVYSADDIGQKLPGGSKVKCMETMLDVVASTVMPGRDGDKNWGAMHLVRASPRTGRTHQIRLHCAYLGLPLMGDLRYGGPRCDARGTELKGHLLHAHRLAFTHPFTQETIQLQAPRPRWLQDFLQECAQPVIV